jgi:hypothetical protein
MSLQNQMSLFAPRPDESQEVDSEEFQKIEAAALTTRARTVATLSTIATIIAHSASPPFSLIDPYTAGLMAIGHVVDSLKLLDIEDSNLTVNGLVEKVAADLEKQFEALKADKTIEALPWRSEIEAWSRGIVDKLLCKKGMGKKVDRLFNTEDRLFYDFQHSLLEEREKSTGRGGIHVKPTTACLTLYLGTLTQSIGDAQAAFAAVIQRQIRRGEYQAALQSAMEHQRVTKQYCVEIQQFRRKILSDAGRQGWSADVMPLIEKTQNEVDDAMTSVTELEAHLDDSFEMLPRDKQSLAERVLTVIRQSRTAYRELQAIMIELPRLYHKCIESQGFASRHIPLPSMRDDVFLPLFYQVTDREQFARVCDAVTFGCAVPMSPVLFDPIACTEILLRPTAQEEIRDDSVGLECVDEDSVALSIFDEATIRKARQTLLRIDESSPATLSQINDSLCAEGYYEEAVCVALMVTNAWVHRKLVEGVLKPSRTYREYTCTSCSGEDYLIAREESGP